MFNNILNNAKGQSKKPIVKKQSPEELMSMFGLADLPVCQICKLTEEKTRCDISKSQKQKCGLAVCRKCLESNPDKQCEQAQTGCKKKMKEHRFKNFVKQKLKNNISSRFEKQSKFRSQLKVQAKYSEIDEDMTHILAALLGQSGQSFSGYKKQLDKLIQDLKKMKNTIQSQIQRGNKPIFRKQIYSEHPQQDDGIIACGYPKDDFSKGKNQIIRSFQ